MTVNIIDYNNNNTCRIVINCTTAEPVLKLVERKTKIKPLITCCCRRIWWRYLDCWLLECPWPSWREIADALLCQSPSAPWRTSVCCAHCNTWEDIVIVACFVLGLFFYGGGLWENAYHHKATDRSKGLHNWFGVYPNQLSQGAHSQSMFILVCEFKY